MSEQADEKAESDSGEEKGGTINDPLTRKDADAPKQSWSGGSEE